MNLQDIDTNLENSDFQYRLKAISALRSYPVETAVPRLTHKVDDPEFLVRSFVARELGNQQTSDSFATLLQMTKFDNTPNVRAEAANSLSLFGPVAVPHLVSAFMQDDHWLVRRSILAALTDMEAHEALLEVSVQGLQGDDAAVQETAISALAILADTAQHADALSQLLLLTTSSSWRSRASVARALQNFKDTQAQNALDRLRQDTDHRVVGATLEDLVQP
jgi:HEAT repeat protein